MFMQLHRFVAAFVVLLACDSALAEDVRIAVDGGVRHQAYEGFGATTLSLVYEGPMGDPLGPKLRPLVLEALYGQVKLTMGNVNVGLLESPRSWNERQNDNDDPFTINWAGFNTFSADHAWRDVVLPGSRLGLDDYSLEGKINARWVSPWLAKVLAEDRDRGMNECAEQVEACVAHWQRLTGSLPRFVHLFNEPTSGNGEVPGADAAMLRDIVIHAGRRLERAGFKSIRFVVPNEETVQRSIEVTEVMLADPEARRYVAAIGYHVYPYGSPYASVPRILSDSGSGRSHPASVEERHRLRDLCRKYDVPLWMTEVSHGEVDPRSFDHLRGRAIHIHDEFVHADASAFYGMNAMWDTKSHRDHFAGRGGEKKDGYLTEQDTIVLADVEAQTVLITGMGYAIGHYARWLQRGAVRVECSSGDPLVQVSAFRDDARQRLTLVVINNAQQPRKLQVKLNGLSIEGQIKGEQSREQVRWEAIKGPGQVQPNGFSIEVPALSVSSLAASIHP